MDMSTRAASSDTLVIRPATRGEIPEIAALIEAALEAYKGEAPDLVLKLYVELSRDVATRWGDGDVLVAVRDGRIAGTVTFYADAGLEHFGLPHGWAGFRTLAVHPAAQGQGVGSQLVQSCLAMARPVATTVGIHTGAFMRSALSIYRRLGFVRAPAFDFPISRVFGHDPRDGEVQVLAYRLDLAAGPARRTNPGEGRYGDGPAEYGRG